MTSNITAQHLLDMSGHQEHPDYLVARGILLGGGLTGIVELLPDGTVINTPWPGDRRLESQKDIRTEAQAYHRIAQHFDGHIRFVKLIEFSSVEHILTIEYMPHGTLRDYLQSNGQDITINQRFSWIKAMAEGLDLLHSISIIHCDLTPHNLFLDSELELKIADFGCCSIDQSTSSGVADARFYRPQASWKLPASFDDDLFALGSCIYEVLTGSPPFENICSPQVRALYRLSQFPDLAGLYFSDIIRDCWLQRATSARSVYSRILQSWPADSNSDS